MQPGVFKWARVARESSIRARRGRRGRLLRPTPNRPEVGDDRWVPLAGPTSQRAGEGSARGWAKAWAAVLQASSGAGGGPRPTRAVRARKGKKEGGLVELGRGRVSRPRKERRLSFFS